MNYLVLNGSLQAPKLHQLEILSAEDSYLYSSNNKKYIDLNSGLWNVTIGNDKEFNLNMKTALNSVFDNNMLFLDISSYNNPLYEKTAKVLLDFINENNSIFTNVFFTNSGSESLELSYKLVNTIIEDKLTITLNHSYHGTFYGGMALSGITKSYVESHNPDYSRIKNIDLPISKEEQKEFFNKLATFKEKIGSVFIEPVISSGGIKFSDLSFYNKLIEFCQANSILVVFDEVATGFYKTGKRFFFNHLSYTPDIICLSKSINNGVLPAGAVLINDEIYKKAYGKKAEHFSTQNGNLLCLTSIYETIRYYLKNDIMLKKRVSDIENLMLEFKNSFSREFRNIGLMTAFPVSNPNVVNTILSHLKKQNILPFAYETELDQGLLIVPNINCDRKLLQKTIKYILKTLEKFD